MSETKSIRFVTRGLKDIVFSYATKRKRLYGQSLDTVRVGLGRGEEKLVPVGTYQMKESLFCLSSNVEYHRSHILPKRGLVRPVRHYRKRRRIKYTHIPYRERFDRGSYRNTKGCLYGYSPYYPHSRLMIRFEESKLGNENASLTYDFRNMKSKSVIGDIGSSIEVSQNIRRYWIYADSIFRVY